MKPRWINLVIGNALSIWLRCRAVEGVGLRPFACWDCGFESRRLHGRIFLFWVFCVIRYRFLSWADHSSRGILPIMVCLSVIVKPRQCGSPDPLRFVAPWKEKSRSVVYFYTHTFTAFCIRVMACYHSYSLFRVQFVPLTLLPYTVLDTANLIGNSIYLLAPEFYI
jgi:hypothetical protein